jgi:amino acid adenylation domain-containing protein
MTTFASDESKNLSSRLAQLTPEKRALLARRLAERSATQGGDEVIVPRGDPTSAPLSYAQELVWLYEQMTPGTSAYNVPMVRRVRGPLDLAALERAFTTVVARHESLRTVFVETEGIPRQEVLAAKPMVLAVHDLRSDALAAEVQAERLLREEAARPFDLASDTFPRVVIVRLTDDDSLMLIVIHHAVFDGGSITVLFRELSVAYDAALAGEVPDLPPLRIQLADYATWERHTLTEAKLGPSVDFWRDYLDGAPASIDLTTDFVRPARATGPGARYITTLPASSRSGVAALAKESEATPFMVLFAAFQVLLHRYSGQSDVVVGTALAGRSRGGTENLIGYLANTLALRARFTDDLTFAEVLRQARDSAIRAFDHADVPYERLVRALRSEHAVAEPSLFRVMFTLQESGGPPGRLGEATLVPAAIELDAAKFDLSVSATLVDDGIRVAVEYRTDLFRPETIERFVGHFDVLLHAATSAPETRVSCLPLASAEERRHVVHDFNDTRREFPSITTLDGLVEQQVMRTPNACAVRAADGELSYAELDARATQLAHWLRANGVRRGTLVGVLMERSLDMVVALLATLKAGAAYVPLDPEYPIERLEHMIADAAPPVVLTQARFTGLVSRATALAIDSEWANVQSIAADEWPTDDARSSADPAYVIYTSGSTGTPKGVVISHGAIVNHTQWMQRAFPLHADDAVLQKTPVSFDASVWEFWSPLSVGALLVLAEPGAHREPARLVSAIQRHSITVVQLVPSVLAVLLDTPGVTACTSLRRMFCGGEPLSPELVARTLELLHVELHNLYGPAETTIDATVWSAPPHDARVRLDLVPIGRPVDNVRAYVLSAGAEPSPVGVPGELWIGGAGVGLGYHGRPDLTAERFVRDPFAPDSGHLATPRIYRTGDRARWRADGQLEYLGRLDEQVKVRGVRVELGEIETALLAQPGVSAAAATTHDHDGKGARLSAYVVPNVDAILEPRALLRALEGILPAAFVPSAIMVLSSMPLSPSGKLDRRALPAPRFESLSPFVAPRNDIESVIIAIWCEVLGHETVSTDAGFMELGGHSLLATRITIQIGKIFRVTLPLRRFFEAPTVAGIARAVEALEAKPGQAAQIARLFLKAQRMTAEERERLRRDNARPAPTTGTP